MLSDKDRAVYDFIRQQTERGIPPTVREICGALGLKSTSTAHRYINRLVDAGYLEKLGNQNRALRLTGQQMHMVPLLRELLPAETRTALQNVERYVSFDVGDTVAPELFAWQLRGLALPEAGILSADIVIVQPLENWPSSGLVLVLRDAQEQVIRLPEKLGKRSQQVLLGKILGVFRTY